MHMIKLSSQAVDDCPRQSSLRDGPWHVSPQRMVQNRRNGDIYPRSSEFSSSGFGSTPLSGTLIRAFISVPSLCRSSLVFPWHRDSPFWSFMHANGFSRKPAWWNGQINSSTGPTSTVPSRPVSFFRGEREEGSIVAYIFMFLMKTIVHTPAHQSWSWGDV